MPADPPEVARILRRLRDAQEGRPSTARVAAEVNRRERGNPDDGLTQSAVSRYERGFSVPPAAAIRELGQFYGATADELERMLMGSREARTEDARVILHRPYEHHFQAQIKDAEDRAVAIRALAVGSLVPGIVQTDAYAGVLAARLDGEDRARWLRNREATRRIVEDGRRDIEVVLMPNPLGITWGSRDVMAGQIDRLIEVSRYGHVRLGVVTRDVPFTRDVRSDSTLYRFADGRRVIYGVQDGTAIVDDDVLLTKHEEIMDATAAAAAWGDDARAVLAELRRWYEGET